MAVVSTAAWSAKVFDPALPGRSSIASDSMVASQAPERMEAVAFLVKRASCPFLV